MSIYIHTKKLIFFFYNVCIRCYVILAYIASMWWWWEVRCIILAMCVWQVMLGDLPNDFLRSGRSREQEDERIAHILQAQQQAGFVQPIPTNIVGRISITLVQVRARSTIDEWMNGWASRYLSHSSFFCVCLWWFSLPANIETSLLRDKSYQLFIYLFIYWGFFCFVFWWSE